MPADSTGRSRLCINLQGAVQGSGLRPQIYRLATEQGLTGWVRNRGGGVEWELEGEQEALRAMLHRVEQREAGLGLDYRVEHHWMPPAGYRRFVVAASQASSAPVTVVPLDRACCAECLRELFDPANRRYRYPFIACTACGPRYTIIESLPYDRERTSMRGFAMCADCLAEFEQAADRRFHAQIIACPRCGPQLELWDAAGRALGRCELALDGAVAALRRGLIVAVKGLGGFHLLADAGNAEAVARLRLRKRRASKPLAVMYPALSAIENSYRLSDAERALLSSPEAPIVLLRQSSALADRAVMANVAAGYPDIGIMLPYTPLHHLLLRDFGAPLVATSGNRSDEVICIDEREVIGRLGDVADCFLVHDRPIRRAIDDSIARILAGQVQLLRCARGFAPLDLSAADPEPGLLAAGGHQKNTLALTTSSGVVLGPHLGDLDSPVSRAAHAAGAIDLQALYASSARRIRCDRHPDYASTLWALSQYQPVAGVQHHYAHALSCMVDNQLSVPVLAVVWDGSGYGLDGSLWGGEFLRVDDDGFSRLGRWRCFPLPGGEIAAREPRRAAFGLLHAVFGDDLVDQDQLPPLAAFSPAERQVLLRMIDKGLNTPLTSSVGRLFDAVAALLGICQRVDSEGHAAGLLEGLAGTGAGRTHYPLEMSVADGVATLDWASALRELLVELAAGESVEHIAAKFHNTLVEGLLMMADHIGLERVVLSGGCFQNRTLSERAIERLLERGFQPYWHRRVPPNDGGLSVGQLLAQTGKPACV